MLYISTGLFESFFEIRNQQQCKKIIYLHSTLYYKHCHFYEVLVYVLPKCHYHKYCIKAIFMMVLILG